ncbi:tRNA dihydrouridine synthase DusB [Trueperella sp. LYQ143]|uniref:tRNA dihydrouridine synthase DusB n=1 Tax=unclassified Trueperella TaxID=2630174 RepID=UPI003982F6FC
MMPFPVAPARIERDYDGDNRLVQKMTGWIHSSQPTTNSAFDDRYCQRAAQYPPSKAGETKAGTLRIGALELGTPIVLAPMAGVTNPPFRQMCRLSAAAAAAELGHPKHNDDRAGTYACDGLYICEMITARALVERSPESLRMIEPDIGDPVRSIQLYGVEPRSIANAVELLIAHGWADHIDLNFGCPVPKVTRKGGGAALPWKHDLFSAIVRAAVRAAQRASGGRVPVTAKFRIGIDHEHETFRDVARMCEDAGIAALTLHARTLTQHYSGQADWSRIAELVAYTQLPVFGNGDIFEAADARDMLAQTGAAGVVVGRGCQGRPWLFYDLYADYHGSSRRARPTLRDVSAIIEQHAHLLVEHFHDEDRAMREMRKHVGWYLRGFSVGGAARHDLALISSREELHERLAALEDQPYPSAAEGKRGRSGGEKRAHLPEGWLSSHELSEEHQRALREAEINVSGG